MKKLFAYAKKSVNFEKEDKLDVPVENSNFNQGYVSTKILSSRDNILKRLSEKLYKISNLDKVVE